MENRFKFRWFSKVRLKMFDVVCIEYPGTIIYKDENGHEIETSWSSDNGVLMQCTGLKDKNEVLIYENDIVRFENGNKLSVGVVEVNKSVWSVSNANFVQGAYCGGALINLHNKCEIIGNVFENLELLTVNNER